MPQNPACCGCCVQGDWNPYNQQPMPKPWNDGNTPPKPTYDSTEPVIHSGQSPFAQAANPFVDNFTAQTEPSQEQIDALSSRVKEQTKKSLGLTADEQDVLFALKTAWNGFIELPGGTQDDMVEFQRAIHQAQQVIALRVARRVNPEIWRQE